MRERKVCDLYEFSINRTDFRLVRKSSVIALAHLGVFCYNGIYLSKRNLIRRLSYGAEKNLGLGLEFASGVGAFGLFGGGELCGAQY